MRIRVRTFSLPLTLVVVVAQASGCAGAPQARDAMDDPNQESPLDGPTEGVQDAGGSRNESVGSWRVADMLGELTLGTEPASRQLVWVLSQLASDAGAISESDMESRLTTSFREALPPQVLNSTFAQLRIAFAGLRVQSVRLGNEGTALTAVAQLHGGTHLRIQLTTEATTPYRIEGLLFQPATDLDREAPATWDAWHALADEIAPSYAMLFAEITEGECRPIRAHRPDEAMPLGSTFKLWVLAALQEAVAAGDMRWEDELEVTDALRSLPSGVTQNDPAGTRHTVRTLAERMISISDNTATDMLITALGRDRVEGTMTRIGASAASRNLPFLMTWEMFALKAEGTEDLRAVWRSADEEGRRAVLEHLTPVENLSALGAWTSPRDVASIEWFGSANDLCNLWIHLANEVERSGDEAAFEIASINPGVRLDPARWTFTAYKGGSEPGVLSLNWMIQDVEGRSFAYIVNYMNDVAPIDESLAVTAAAWGAALLDVGPIDEDVP